MLGISINNGVDNEAGKLAKNINSYYNSVNGKEDIRIAIAGKIYCLNKF